MKKMMLLGAAMALILSVADAGAQRMSGGAGGYSGTGETRGFTSKTGFVKERTEEEDHMDGKTTAADTKATTDDENDVQSPDAADAEDGKPQDAPKGR